MPESARWDGRISFSASTGAGLWQNQSQRARAPTCERPNPMLHTKDIPTCQALKLCRYLTCGTTQYSGCYDVLCPSSGELRAPRASGQDRSNSTACSTTFPLVPADGCDVGLRSKKQA